MGPLWEDPGSETFQDDITRLEEETTALSIILEDLVIEEGVLKRNADGLSSAPMHGASNAGIAGEDVSECSSEREEMGETAADSSKTGEYYSIGRLPRKRHPPARFGFS